MMGIKMKGMADPVTVGIVALCFLAGVYFVAQKKHIDHPVEQVAEAILDAHGIDVDFSASKKDDD